MTMIPQPMAKIPRKVMGLFGTFGKRKNDQITLHILQDVKFKINSSFCK